MKIRPVVFVWTDAGSMVPLPRFLPLCERQFAVGEEYPLTLVEQRSMRSHNHYFASVAGGWDNLPENVAKIFPTADHLRRWCLVECNYCSHTHYGFDTPKDAKVFAKALRRFDEYARITVSGRHVHVRVAKSQALSSMLRDEFEQSKRDVLDLIAAMIGLAREDLEREAAIEAPPRRRALPAPKKENVDAG